jgi:hypothetical protein
MKLQPGEIVCVCGAAGEVFGQVLDVKAPADMIELPGFDVCEVRQVLNELGVIELALIGHIYGDQQVCFFALLTEDGDWFDVQQNPLQISAASTEEKA